jgi:hypothetical protein
MEVIMRDALRLRAWAGPLTIGSFAVVAITGILLFFHAGTGLAKLAHEWLSLLFVMAAVAHTALNWRPFLTYFRRPAGIVIIGVMLALGVASLCISPEGGRGGRGHGPRAFMAVGRALEDSSLRVVAQVAKSSPEAVFEKLASQGVQVRSLDQTVGDIASENRMRGFELLSLIFGNLDVPGAGQSSGHAR